MLSLLSHFLLISSLFLSWFSCVSLQLINSIKTIQVNSHWIRNDHGTQRMDLGCTIRCRYLQWQGRLATPAHAETSRASSPCQTVPTTARPCFCSVRTVRLGACMQSTGRSLRGVRVCLLPGGRSRSRSHAGAATACRCHGHNGHDSRRQQLTHGHDSRDVTVALAYLARSNSYGLIARCIYICDRESLALLFERSK